MRNTRNLVLLDDVSKEHVGRALADVRPHPDIEVPPSGQSGVTLPGSKCDHGVYIPATSLWLDNAPYCSICRPYEILVRSGGVYKA